MDRPSPVVGPAARTVGAAGAGLLTIDDASARGNQSAGRLALAVTVAVLRQQEIGPFLDLPRLQTRAVTALGRGAPDPGRPRGSG